MPKLGSSHYLTFATNQLSGNYIYEIKIVHANINFTS